MSVGMDPSQVVVFGRPEDHAKVKELIDEISGRGPETMARAVVYDL